MRQPSEAQRMYRAALRKVGGVKAWRAAYARFERNLAWLEENRAALLKKYPDMWVAVHDGSLVGADKDFRALVMQVQEKGIHPAETVIRMLSTQDVMIVV